MIILTVSANSRQRRGTERGQWERKGSSHLLSVEEVNESSRSPNNDVASSLELAQLVTYTCSTIGNHRPGHKQMVKGEGGSWKERYSECSERTVPILIRHMVCITM